MYSSIVYFLYLSEDFNIQKTVDAPDYFFPQEEFVVCWQLCYCWRQQHLHLRS